MINLTQSLMKQLFPHGPEAHLSAFVTNQSKLSEILQSPERLSLCCANIFAETGGLTLSSLTESLNYSAERITEVWPNRFNSASDVRMKYGTAPGWQTRAFNDIYGNRMGNRPGSADGSTYIGRGDPQVTGRDGYSEIGRRIGVDLLTNPKAATQFELQPAIIAAFWSWKNLSSFADRGDITGARKAWNGGSNGLDVVRAQYPRMLKAIKAYLAVPTAAVVVKPASSPVDETLKVYQQGLIDLGYHEVGLADGRDGGKTAGAIAAFYKDRHILGAPIIDKSLYSEIDRARAENWHRPVSPDRAYATADQLAPRNATIVAAQKASFWSKMLGYVSGGSTVVGGAVQFMPTAHDTSTSYISMVQEWGIKIPFWVPMAAVMIVAFILYKKSEDAKRATVEDYQTGKLN
jgi:putative chitinase